MKIAISGATGFVGVNLQNYLKSYHNINPISLRFSPNQQFEINDDIIIHLAGKAHDLKKVSIPQEYYEANFELTKQFFDAFLISKATVFIFMSTVKAVADEVEGALTEEALPNPKSHYGIAKYQAERYILSKELPKGKRVYILRPCMIHGPRNKGNLNLLFKLVSKGIPWPLGAFENKRSFCSIDNVCFIIKELIKGEYIPSGVYNIADDEPLSTNEIIELIAQSKNMDPRIYNISKKLINSLAKLGDLFHLPLNTERLQKLTENYIVSSAKIIQAIGKPLPLAAKEGLIKTFQSFNNGK